MALEGKLSGSDSSVFSEEGDDTRPSRSCNTQLATPLRSGLLSRADAFHFVAGRRLGPLAEVPSSITRCVSVVGFLMAEVRTVSEIC